MPRDDLTISVRTVLGGLGRLYDHLSPRRRRQVVLVFALMLVGAVAELFALGAVLPFLSLLADPGQAVSLPLLEKISGLAIGSRPSNLLLMATTVFAILAIGAGGARLTLLWVSQRFAFQVGHDLGVEVYRRTLYQPYGYHVSKNTSELIAGVNKVQMVTDRVLLPLMEAVLGIVIGLFLITALVLVNAQVALLAGLGFGILYFAVTYATRGRLRANSLVIADAQAERVKAIQEGLGGIRDVLIDQAQPVYIDKFMRVDLAFRDAQGGNVFIAAAPRFIIEALGMVIIAALALMMNRSPGGLAASLPVLGALALGAQRLLPLLQLVYYGWIQAAGNRHVLSDVLDILDLPIPARHNGEMATLPFTRDIRLKKISFRYSPDGPVTLHDIDLVISKGSRVGFIGKTGSGKSTIADLIMGMLEPSAGEIRVDGELLSDHNIRAWQSQIAHVPQAIYLSDSTIAENIAFGVSRDSIDWCRLQDAARMAEVAEFIEGLASKYDTLVGERGVRLSGGQRQRIGIARALYKRPRVLVLDEATSALDNSTEAAVMAAIGELDRDLTVMIIAHRLSTVQMCDKVIRMEAGQIVEECAPQRVIAPIMLSMRVR